MNQASPDDEELEALLGAIEDDLSLVGYSCERITLLDELALPESLLAVKTFITGSNRHIQVFGTDKTDLYTPYDRDVIHRRNGNRIHLCAWTFKGYVTIARYDL